MDNDFEIEILDESVEDAEALSLPQNFLTLGEIGPDDVRVYIKQDVYKALEELSASDTSKELGSILLGSYCEDQGKTHVIISQYVEAKYTDASAATLTFTHETWDYIHAQHARLYPDEKIIGWQHTHPNYGIFLSNYDMFIQENFFDLPFQIAYVIDPIQNLRGFFQWKNGKVEKLKGYYIYDDASKPIKIAQTKVTKEKDAPAKPSKATSALLTLLCIATVLLSFFTLSLSRKYNDQLALQNTMITQLLRQKTESDGQSALIASQAERIAQLQAEVDALKAKLAAEPDGKDAPTVTFRVHTVAAGEHLEGICASYGIDYAANASLILAINGIEDPSRIFVGQMLLLPTF